MSFFRHVTFDLDDTLLDTSGYLIPAALRVAIRAMGADEQDVSIWLEKRRQILRRDPRADVWLELAGGDRSIADRGRSSFLTYPIDSLPDDALRMTVGAPEILKWSRQLAQLHLVTSGDEKTQLAKIDRLGIRDFFSSIHVVSAASHDPRHKRSAFEKIEMQFDERDPKKIISVGNRVDTDLGAAKQLGWKTAWMRYGEHATLTPQSATEIPDFEIASLAELLSIWREQELSWKS